jgi:dTMP kinase
MKKGVLIALEGIEGCGKSTQAKMLGDALIKKGKDVVLTYEPGATRIGSSIRNVLLSVDNNNMNNYTELYLYLADRAQHLSEVISPYYRAGKIIISDRFYLSTVVYQGYGRGIDLNLIKQLHSQLPCFIIPDLTFIFDISLEESFRRTTQRIAENHQEQWSRFEKEKRSFHTKIREGFLHVQQNDSEHIKIIDGSMPVNEIGDELLTHVEQLSI